jgi:N-acyl-D-amino-acid deacylase
MAHHLEEALEAGAFGLSSGLIYAPGIHAEPAEVAALVRVAARRGALYATHMRNEAAGFFGSLEEALATTRLAGPGARLQVSHLKAGARAVWGRAGEAVALLEDARAAGLDVAADQYPYTAAATASQCVLRRALALPVDETVAALRDWRSVAGSGRDRRRDLGLGERGRRPGLGRHRAPPGRTRTRPGPVEPSPPGAGPRPRPVDVACDVLAADRLDSWITINCMDEADVETLVGVPWIAVCTDAEGRRPGHPELDAGVPHPRANGSAPRVLGRYVRERGVIPLEAAVAKLTSVPARVGLADRGVVRGAPSPTSWSSIRRPSATSLRAARGHPLDRR